MGSSRVDAERSEALLRQARRLFDKLSGGEPTGAPSQPTSPDDSFALAERAPAHLERALHGPAEPLPPSGDPLESALREQLPESLAAEHFLSGFQKRETGGGVVLDEGALTARLSRFMLEPHAIAERSAVLRAVLTALARRDRGLRERVKRALAARLASGKILPVTEVDPLTGEATAAAPDRGWPSPDGPEAPERPAPRSPLGSPLAAAQEDSGFGGDSDREAPRREPPEEATDEGQTAATDATQRRRRDRTQPSGPKNLEEAHTAPHPAPTPGQRPRRRKQRPSPSRRKADPTLAGEERTATAYPDEQAQSARRTRAQSRGQSLSEDKGSEHTATVLVHELYDSQEPSSAAHPDRKMNKRGEGPRPAARPADADEQTPTVHGARLDEAPEALPEARKASGSPGSASSSAPVLESQRIREGQARLEALRRAELGALQNALDKTEHPTSSNPGPGPQKVSPSVPALLRMEASGTDVPGEDLVSDPESPEPPPTDPRPVARAFDALWEALEDEPDP